MVKCAVCGKEFETDRQLHAHLKAHKLRMVEYYQKYFPRYDKYDNKIIKFKNKEQYFESDFNSRTNLRMWLKNSTNQEVKDYCKDILIKRKEKKNLTYTPCQAELRSLVFPPIQYYNQIFGDYYKLCSELGFKNKHKNCGEITVASEWQNPEYEILIDTREQRPLKFKRNVKLMKLDYGDYAFSSSEASCKAFIERKAVGDFLATISGGYERFEREIKRSIEDDANLIIIIEQKLSSVLYFNHQRKGHGGRVYSKVKATPEFIFHRVRSMSQKFPTIQFLFVDGKRESARVIEKIFTSGCVHKKIDLQLAYDEGKL
jgi:ERCC4-type nuclease